MIKFNPGDRIGWIPKNAQYLIYYGKILKYSYNSIYSEDEYVIEWDDKSKGIETHSFDSVKDEWFRINTYPYNNLEDFAPVGLSLESARCDHKWQLYLGLNESFEFCTVCDEKRKNNG